MNSLLRTPARALSAMESAVRSYWTGPFTLKDPALNKLFHWGTESQAGPRVTEFTAFMCAAFYDGINQISSDVAKLPLNLHKRRKDGGSDLYTESKLYDLLKYQPNPETTSMVFRRSLIMDALVTHGGYAEIERDKLGRPAALWRIEPNRIAAFYDETAVVDGRKNPLRYRVDGEVFEAKDIIHIQGLGDGVGGLEMIQVAREAIGLALASQQFAAAFFGNGTRFGGVLSSDMDLTTEQRDEVREAIEALHAKADKAFRLLVLSAGLKYTPTGSNLNDAQMKDIRDQQVAEIARFLNMPLHKLKLNTPGAVSYASVEMASLDYYKGCLLNWITLCEEEFCSKLIPRLERSQQFIKHNVNAFLRGTIKERYEALGIARDKGIVNADEWRELEDMNPQANGQGKLYLVQSAQIPVDQLTQLVDAQIGELQAKTEKLKEPTPAPQTAPGQEELAAANDRAEKAEALAAAAQQEAEAARLDVARAQGRDEASQAEIARLVTAAEQREALSVELTKIATEARADADRHREAADAAEQLRSEVADACALAEQQAREALERAEQAEAIREQAIAKLSEAGVRAGTAAGERSLALARVAEVEAEIARVGMEKAAADEARDAAIRDAAAATTLADELQRERDAAREAAAVATTQAEEARVAAEAHAEAAIQAHADAVKSSIEEMAVRVTEAERIASERAAEAERTSAEATRLTDEARQAAEAHIESATSAAAEAARIRVEELAARVEQAAGVEAAALERATTAEQRAAERDATLKAWRETALARDLAVLTAHRDLIADAMGRMVRRECEQARSKQATPEKLRRWLDGFGTLHTTICIEALVPAMRTHLAWMQKGDDPTVVTRALVETHIEQFTAAVRDVIAAPPEDFHAELERVLTRWELHEAARVADTLLHEEIRHVRTTD